MDKKDLEDLKKRLENAEFNNSLEDSKISQEEKEEKKNNNDFQDLKDNKKNMIIIALVICVVILLAIVLIFLFSGKNDTKSNNSNNYNNNNSNEEKKENNEKDKIIKEEDYNYTNAKVYFNKYVYVKAKDDKKIAITDLDGNILEEINSNWKIFEGKEKDLYLIELKGNENITIKRIKDNLVHDVYNDKATGLLLGKEKENLIGFYNKDSDYDTIYIIDGNTYNTTNLDNFGAYNNSNKDVKYIYNNKYLITYYNNEKSDYDSYGIYDIKAKKQLIKNSYDKIEYLHDDIFIAIKNDKSGVIDSNNKVLLDFKYDLVTYSNNLYFVGEKNKLNLYDKNLNDLNKDISIPNLDKFTYNPCCGAINPFDLINYNSYVIVRIGTQPDAVSDYIVVDKDGNSTSLGKGYIGFIGQSLIRTSSEDNYLYMYDENLNITHKIDVGQRAIKIDRVSIFLNNTLVIDGTKLYNLKNDSAKGSTNWYRRESQEFNIRLDFKGETGTITVSSNDVELKKLEGVSVDAFLNAEDNGITITKNYFIYNAGGVIILKRVEQNKPE